MKKRRQKYSIKIFDGKNWMTKWHANAEYTTTKYSITKYSVTKIFDDKNIRWQNMLHLLAISGPSMPVLGHGCLFFASSAVAFGFLWPLPILGLACRFFDHQNKNIKIFSKYSLRKISAKNFPCNVLRLPAASPQKPPTNLPQSPAEIAPKHSKNIWSSASDQVGRLISNLKPIQLEISLGC